MSSCMANYAIVTGAVSELLLLLMLMIMMMIIVMIMTTTVMTVLSLRCRLTAGDRW